MRTTSWFVLLCGISLVAGRLVCTTSMMPAASFIDAWQSFPNLPTINVFPQLKCEHSSSMTDILLCAGRDVIARSAQVIGQLRFPKVFVAADGMFNVSIANNMFMASNILLLVEPSLSQRGLCTAVSAMTTNADIRNAACRCWSGTPLVDIVSSGTSIDASLLGMCAVHPCQRPQCIVTVDPNQRACISAPEDYSVIYSLTTPHLVFPTPSQTFLSRLPEPIAAFVSHFAVGASQLLSYINSYYLAFIFGLIILHNAEDIAALELTRVLVSVILGVFLAAVSIILLLYRTGHSYFRSGVSYVDAFLQPSAAAVIASFVYYTMHSNLLSFISNYMLLFWESGAFGFSWLGKAYFVSSIAITLIGVYRWNFFAPETLSFAALHSFIICCAASLLYSATSHSGLGLCLMVYGLFCHAVAEFCRPYLVYFVGYFQTPIYKYTGVKLSMREYEKSGALFTAANIKHLRDVYKTSPQAYSKMMSLFAESGRVQEAMLLEQFMLGTYAGLPVMPAEEKEKSSLPILKLLGVVVCFVVIGACIYVGYFPTVV